MKMKKKTIIIGVALIIVIVVIVLFLRGKKTGPQYTTTEVQRGTVTQSVEATGSVASADDVSLSFKTGGRVNKVSAMIGMQVNKDDILASVADTTLTAQLDRARASVAQEKADYAKLLAGATSEEVAVSQQQVDATRTDLASAKSALDFVKSSQALKKDQFIDTALQSLTDSLFACDYTLSTIYDSILNSTAESRFLTTNAQQWQDAKLGYKTATRSVVDARAVSSTAKVTQTPVDILAALESMRGALVDVSQVLDSALGAVTGAIPNASYSPTTIDGYKTSFNARSTAQAAAKASVLASITDLTVDTEQLQKEYEDAVFKVESAENALKLQEARYALTTAEPKEYEIQQSQARIMQAEADARSVESQIADALVRAPIDGTITRVDIKIGEMAAPNADVIHMIGESKLKIDVDIPESDINKVQVGQNVTITLDAFGPDVIFDGTVSFIEPSERIIQDVVYYRVTVLFNEGRDTIKSGMTATIRIATAMKEAVLFIPLRAVTINQDGSKTVKVMKADQTTEVRSIVTGIRGDDGSVEIASGVSQGEKIIVGEAK